MQDSGRRIFLEMGALPPNPRDLSPFRPIPETAEQQERGGLSAPSPVLALVAALGSVPTVALSSARG